MNKFGSPVFASTFFAVLSLAAVICDGCGQFSKNPEDIRERAPWVAAIFQSNSQGDWIYVCGATLTSSGTAITAANCVQEKSIQRINQIEQATHRHLNYSALRVVAGLRSANYSDRDEHTQEAEVGMIREHQASSGYKQNILRAVNLAGIHLKTSFKTTSFVNPVCMVEVPNSPEELFTTQQGQPALIAGFDQQRHNPSLELMTDHASPLQIFNLTVESVIDCYNRYRSGYENVVCTKLSNGINAAIPCSMEGHGMIVQPPNQSALYLMGVYTSNTAKYDNADGMYATMSISDAQCGPDDLIFATKYGQFYRWGISHQFCDIGQLQCQSYNCRPLEELCDGIANCEDKTDESETVCFNQKVCQESEFRCLYGACIDGGKICDGNMDCADNSDEADDHCHTQQ